MSLLIDALKRAEQAKRGQTEPPFAPPNTIERAIDAEGKPLDWALAEPVSDPVVGEPVPHLSEAPSRTEPKFSQPVAESGPTPSSAPSEGFAKATINSGKLDNQRIHKEREAAQTLFQAKRPGARSRAGILMVSGLAVLLLAAGGFYVWYSFAFPPSPPIQPVQARNPVPTAPLAPAPSIAVAEPIRTAEPIAPSAPQLPPEPPSSDVAEKGSNGEAATLSQKDVEQPPKAKRSRRGATRSSASRMETEVATDPSTEETVRREIDDAQRKRGARSRQSAKIEPRISVSKDDRGSNDFDPDLALAYNALLSGQRAEAKRLYSIVAERDPFNVDALLGLATLAANQGDLNAVERYYRRALELEPQNAAALAGLASIRQPGGPSESQIKFELARTPDSPHLHFALGNQLANQGRWDEAQQAYFDAFSLDAGNPDYAYNLAVSLDQLGQSKQAATYYRKALDLAKNRNARFRSADVESRLGELAATP